MKVIIKKYGHCNPFVEFFRLIRMYGIANWLEERLNNNREYVRIDNFDTWNLDHTLSLIILPALKKLRKKGHSAAFVEYEDVPSHLWPKKTLEECKQIDFFTGKDTTLFERWNWVLDEMIYAFTQIHDDEWEDKYHQNGNFDSSGYQKEAERIQNGFVLFGKYYQSLWD